MPHRPMSRSGGMDDGGTVKQGNPRRSCLSVYFGPQGAAWENLSSQTRDRILDHPPQGKHGVLTKG